LPIGGLGTKRFINQTLIPVYEPHLTTWSQSIVWKEHTFSLDVDWIAPNQIGFQDAIALRTGTELAVLPHGLKMRGGYGYVSPVNPTPTSNGNLLDNPKHILSLGLGGVMNPNKFVKGRVVYDAALQWQFWVE